MDNTLKQIALELKENSFNSDERRTIIESMDTNDFIIGNYRFINMDKIDEIQKDELLSDTYTLGCFTSWFIADITGLTCDVVEKAQETESFELLGALMEKEIDEVQEKYASVDGYGHHFSGYDGSEVEIDGFYMFRIN